jgi:hypothetical protein
MASLLSVIGVASGEQRRELPTRCVSDDHGEPARHLRLVARTHPAPAATSGALADPAELTRHTAQAVARFSVALDTATASSFLHALRRGPLRETLDALIEDCERFVTVIAPDAIQSGDGATLRTHARRMAAAVRTLDMNAREGTRLPDTAHGVQRALLRSALGDKDVQRAVAQLAELFTALANTATIERPRFGASVPLRASLSRPGSLIAGALAMLSLVTGGLAYGASSAPTTPAASDSLHGVSLSSLSSRARRALLPIYDRDDRDAATNGENRP